MDIFTGHRHVRRQTIICNILIIYVYIYIYICIHVDLSGKLYLSFQHLKCRHRRNKPWFIEVPGVPGVVSKYVNCCQRSPQIALDDWMMGKSTRKRNTPIAWGQKLCFPDGCCKVFPSINLWNAKSMSCNWLYIYIYLDEV